MKYKAVIFDLFGTLVYKFPVDESIDVLRDMAEVLGVPEEPFIRLWFDTFDERHSGTFPNLEADIDYVTQKLDVHPDKNQLRISAQINLDYVAAHVESKPDTIEVLSALRKSGIKTGLVSNWSDEVPTIWNDNPLSGYFDVSVFSCRVGIMKPDPRIYHMACDQLSVQPSECLFVGDGDSSELAGASGVGMTAVLIGGDDTNHWSGITIQSLKEILKMLD